jgi:hypothetical protein
MMVKLQGPEAINPRWLCGRLGLWGTFTTEKLHNDPNGYDHMVYATYPEWLLAAEGAQA